MFYASCFNVLILAQSVSVLESTSLEMCLFIIIRNFLHNVTSQIAKMLSLAWGQERGLNVRSFKMP